MIRRLSAFAAYLAVGLLFALNLQAQTPFTPSTINTTPGSATNAPAGGVILNNNFISLQAQLAGQLFIPASGDMSGATDRANLVLALNNMAASNRLNPGASAFFPTAKVVFGPGTFYFTAGGIAISGATNTLKLQGIWLQGSGRGVTSIDYNPSTSGPLFQNNRGLDLKISDFTFFGHDPASDFLWDQEQAGVSNIQDEIIVDNDWQGSWQWIERLTGGNNNSEHMFTHDAFTGLFVGGIYTPPAIVTSITSGSSTISATNLSEQVAVGDTGSFTAAVAPLAANTQYYVISATTSGFQVATTPTGAAVSFTATGTPSFNTASDQFLNFWLDDIKWWTQSSPGQLFMMNKGGSIKVSHLDVSGHGPTAGPACIFNLLGAVHAGGVMSFQSDGRIEHTTDNSCTIHSQWNGGSIMWENLDESSQAGVHAITNKYAQYEVVNASGPLISYKNSQLMGQHLYNYAVASFNFQNSISYDNVTLLENPTAANFAQFSGSGNTGGLPVIHFRDCRNIQSAAVVGFKEICDTDLNWQFSVAGATEMHHVSCVGANSDFPASGGKVALRFPLNAVIVETDYWNPTGASAGGAYQYTIQTEEATPTVLAGGPSTPMAGAAATTPLPITGKYTVTSGSHMPFQMTTDLARTIDLIDTLPRSGAFTGPKCQIDYIGQNIQPPANDEFFADLSRAA